MSAFADPRILKLLRNDFIPCTADDWYQRRRQDDEGAFFRRVADQSTRKGAGTGTRQGIYCLTADGELLNMRNAGDNADVTYDQLRTALVKFAKLPAARTAAGAVTIPPHGKVDENFTRTPPAGGTILRVNARILDRTDAGGFCKSTCGFTGGDMAARDFCWLSKAEVTAMAPPKEQVGFTYSVPVAVAVRLCRFHLVDNTRGEPDFWGKNEVFYSEFTLTVTASNGGLIDLRIDGVAEMRTDSDSAKAARGYEPKLSGTLRYNTATTAFEKAEFAALGLHWGESTFTRQGARPGKGLLGVAFTLADPAVPADRVAPEGARDRGAYFRND